MNKKKTDVSKDVYEVIATANKKRDEELADLREKLKQAEAAEAKSEQSADQMLKTGTADQYAKEKAEARSAADRAEFYRRKLQEMKSSPLYVGEDMSKMVDAVRETTQSTIDVKLQEATNLIRKSLQLAVEAKAAAESANDALEMVEKNTGGKIQQFDVFLLSGCINIISKHQHTKPLSDYWK